MIGGADKRRAIVLMDAFGTVEEVIDALGDDRVHFEIIRSDTVPRGSEVFALMVGPETPVSARDVGSLPGLKIVAVTSTGFDHVPVKAITEAGAWVTTPAGYCTEEVAEHAVALVLCGLRGIPALNSAVRAGEWDVVKIAPKRIDGSTVGLLGFGRIAQSVARRLCALGVKVKAYDPVLPDETFERMGVKRVGSSLEAIRDADAMSIHVPLTPETTHLVDADSVAALRPGTFLVNVARGELIEQRAMLDALRTGQLSGAGLDVFEKEPLPANDSLREVPNVLLGPHGAWYSAGAEKRLFTMATHSILDVFHGRTPTGVVAVPG